MKTRHISLAVGLAAIWGFNFVVMEIGLRHYPPLLYAGLRFALAAFPAVLIVGGPRAPWRWVIAAGASLGVAQYALLLIGMRAGMPAGLTSLVLQLQALFTVGFAVVLIGERVSSRRAIGMGIAFAGLVLIAYGFRSGGPVGAFLLTIGAAAGWGLGNVAVRKAAPASPMRFMVWMSAAAAVPLLGLSLVIEGRGRVLAALSAPTAEGIASVIYVTAVSTLLGWGIWFALLRRYDASIVAPYSLLIPVFGMSSAALVTSESISPLNLIAGTLIVAGVFYANGRADRKQVPVERPSYLADLASAARARRRRMSEQCRTAKRCRTAVPPVEPAFTAA